MDFALGIVIAFGAVGFADLIAIDRATRLAIFSLTNIFACRGVVALYDARCTGTACFFDELAVVAAIIAFGTIAVAAAFVGILIAGSAGNGIIAGVWRCAAGAFDFAAGRRAVFVGAGDRVDFAFGIVIAFGAVGFANLVAIGRTAGGAVGNFTGVFAGRGVITLDDAGCACVARLFDELAVFTAVVTLRAVIAAAALISVGVAIAGHGRFRAAAFHTTAGR